MYYPCTHPVVMLFYHGVLGHVSFVSLCLSCIHHQQLDVSLTVHHELCINYILIIYYILITNLMHRLWFIYLWNIIPLHVSSHKCSSSGGYNCTHAAYGTVTLYKSSRWPVGTQREWELTVGQRLLVGDLRHPPTTFLLRSVLTHAAYRLATVSSRREWQYRVPHVYNCILLKMSVYGSKHVEE